MHRSDRTESKRDAPYRDYHDDDDGVGRGRPVHAYGQSSTDEVTLDAAIPTRDKTQREN
jgi:hypothetical protein